MNFNNRYKFDQIEDNVAQLIAVATNQLRSSVIEDEETQMENTIEELTSAIKLVNTARLRMLVWESLVDLREAIRIDGGVK